MEKKNNSKFTGDLRKIKSGTWFRAEIELVDVIGQVQNESEGIYSGVYLCQNKKNGNFCDDRLGFRYSWAVSDRISELNSFGVTNFNLLKSKPKNFVFKKLNLPITIEGKEVTFKKGYIEVGCTQVSNKTVKAIVKKLKY